LVALSEHTSQKSNAELISEQAYIDRAYECLDRTRVAASAIKKNTEHGPGGTFQARFERDVIHQNVAQRLAALELGDQSLCFGRIDLDPESERHAALEVADRDSSFYIGRLAVSDDRSDPVVVDWRAPIAESFYRATGPDPMGLRRRRHFTTRGRRLLGIDDELFGSSALGLDQGTLQGEGALIAALESARSGRLSDIVATIQSEQDQVIRAPLPGVLVVQGGPGTGKTVVALHRAAYLLYTYRFPLEGQGVLVIGPNRLFLSYIEQVLPSLGEAGVEIAVMADLVPHIRATGVDRPPVAYVKGELRICKLLSKAVRDRQRRLPETVVIPSGVEFLRVTPEDSDQLIAHARRRSRGHNLGRRHLETAFFDLLSQKMRNPLDSSVVRERLRSTVEVREALERMWPVLTPSEFLRDLFGSRALLRLAGSKWFSDAELDLLYREREPDPQGIIWSSNDVPLLDEALELLGPRPKHKAADQIRTYGHIVVDEAQDLSPMALRLIDRRSLNGSMTIVGDIAQSTGAHAHDDWSSVLAHLPDRHAPRFVELSLGYRLPGPAMELASRVLKLAAPGLEPPASVRQEGAPPIVTVAGPGGLGDAIVAAVRRELVEVGAGNVAVIVPEVLVDPVQEVLEAAQIDFGRAKRGSLDHQLTVTPVSLVKGLELDSCIVVEPQTILEAEHRGPQSLYVALTRATRRLTVVHERPLPEALVSG
jgi:DNA helicase IV